MNVHAESKQFVHKREHCSICNKLVFEKSGKYICGTVLAVGIPKRRFYCNDCIKKGRKRLCFVILVILVLVLISLFWFF